MAQRIGVVLAGGIGRRMGRTKGDVVLGESTLAERAARVLWPLCGSVLVSVAPNAPNPAAGFRAIEDEPPAGRGPLAGLVAAFRETGASDLLVLACDYPYVSTELLAALVLAARPESDLVMPTDRAGRDHPLVALWKRSAQPHVERALDEGTYRVRSILRELEAQRVGSSELGGIDLDPALENWNLPEDLYRG